MGSPAAAGEHCVSDLVDRLAIDQPKVSHHLAILRAAAIVRSRRDGRHINYSLRPQVHRRVESAEGVTDVFDLGEISVTFRFGREAAVGIPSPPRQMAHAAGAAAQAME